MTNFDNISIVILAGGKSERFVSNKSFFLIDGKEAILHSINTFLNVNSSFEINLVVPKNDVQTFKNLLEKEKITNIHFVEAGKYRFNSSFNGVINATKNIVLIHDGARPFVSEKLISNLIETLDENLDGVAPFIPLVDAQKIVNSENFVIKTMEKNSNQIAIQTPQIFWRKSWLKEAKKIQHDQFSSIVDDVQILESKGNIKIVEGDFNNIKLTYSNKFN